MVIIVFKVANDYSIQHNHSAFENTAKLHYSGIKTGAIEISGCHNMKNKRDSSYSTLNLKLSFLEDHDGWSCV